MMDRMWDPDGIPDTSQVPVDTYELEIGEILETETSGREGSALPAGCLMYEVHHTIADAANTQHRGLMLRDWFVIGTADDPEARDPKTWNNSIGAKQLKRMVTAARVTVTNNLSETLRNCIGAHLIAFVDIRGNFNDVKNYYKLGERAVGEGNVRPGRAKPGVTPRPNGPTVARPPVPASPATVAASALTPPAPVPARAAAPPKAKKADKVPCPLCSEEVERSAFKGHMDGHDEAEAEA